MAGKDKNGNDETHNNSTETNANENVASGTNPNVDLENEHNSSKDGGQGKELENEANSAVDSKLPMKCQTAVAKKFKTQKNTCKNLVCWVGVALLLVFIVCVVIMFSSVLEIVKDVANKVSPEKLKNELYIFLIGIALIVLLAIAVICLTYIIGKALSKCSKSSEKCDLLNNIASPLNKKDCNVKLLNSTQDAKVAVILTDE